MGKGQILVSDGSTTTWRSQKVAKRGNRTQQKDEDKESLSLSDIVINTGAKRYGLPPDAKERRM